MSVASWFGSINRFGDSPKAMLHQSPPPLSEDDDGDHPILMVLLVVKVLIWGQKNVEAGFISFSEQLPISQPVPP